MLITEQRRGICLCSIQRNGTSEGKWDMSTGAFRDVVSVHAQCSEKPVSGFHVK